MRKSLASNKISYSTVFHALSRPNVVHDALSRSCNSGHSHTCKSQKMGMGYNLVNQIDK